MNPYTINSDKTRLDVGVIHRQLSEQSCWAAGRSREIVERSIEGSLCFGVYQGPELVGFARVVTDGATFAWLCDVFILDGHRGQELSKRLLASILADPALQRLRLFLLATRDAHELYARYGKFQLLDAPEMWMVKREGQSD